MSCVVAKRSANSAQPFLKWAGGKQWLAQSLRARCQYVGGRYFEPFLGGGALFFALSPSRARLSDSNANLIELYEAIKSDVDKVVRLLKRLRRANQGYYAVRDSKPASPEGRAARFLYLNRTCWNGLYRVNRLGKFNVPAGRFATPPDVVREERLRQASQSLQHASLISQDFEDACSAVSTGDLVYCDPPYTVTHENNGFVRYNESIYSWRDQQRLSSLMAALDRKGAAVIISNAAHASIRGLYKGLSIWRVTRKSLLASSDAARRPVSEYVVSNLPLGGSGDDTGVSWARVAS